jgi:DhnA-type fructose-1,6-bisphosphate aldolase and related enzymes
MGRYTMRAYTLTDKFKSIFARRGRSIVLAYDHGIEHGPTDFLDNPDSAEPEYILKIARDAGFDGVVFQRGVAEKYYDGSVPLILKLNGKTSLYNGAPVSAPNCTVEEAVSLGASAVGFTIYAGSDYEWKQVEYLAQIKRDAVKFDMPLVVWSYPRGGKVDAKYNGNEHHPEVVAYAARIALELGADAMKIKYTGDPKTFAWAVRVAGKVPVLMSGGPKMKTDEEFLRQVEEVISVGALGVAVGRNVWQRKNAVEFGKLLGRMVYEGKKVAEILEPAVNSSP